MSKLERNSETYRRTRDAHRMETAEDYVEAVEDILSERGNCRLTDLARRFDVSHVTASRIVERLVREGWLETEPYQPIRLSRKGKRLATRCRARHETVYRFLLAIGVSPKIAAVDAEGIEHHVSAETLKQFESIVRKQESSSAS